MFACVLRNSWFVALSPLVGLIFAMPGVCAEKEAAPRVPDPQQLNLETRDGVAIRCTYYRGGFIENLKTKQVATIPGREVVPIILVHGWEGQGTEYDVTAGMLQRFGHAVIVPDLRGHGETLNSRFAGRIDRDRMSRADVDAMKLDIDAAKKFLLERNNAQELNIEMLCVVGAEFGATLAVKWAAEVDWNWPQLPGRRQGRDVKALVLLSPVQSFKGVSLNAAVQSPAVGSLLSIMIVAGEKDSKNERDARTMYDRLAKFRGAAGARDRATAREDLLLLEPPTSLSGTKLLTPKGLTVNQDIARFIHGRLVTRKGDFPWAERKDPLSRD